MRRIGIWIASTITIIVLLFGYHTSTNQTSTTGNATVGNTTTSSTSTPVPSTTSSSSSSGSPPNDPSSSSSPSASTSSAPKKKTSTTKTITGAVAQTQWGPVQVKLKITNGKITAVNVDQYPDGNPRDAQINSYALPILVQETLSAQNAHIDMVSGATVTSDGYLQSLQSALDKAGI